MSNTEQEHFYYVNPGIGAKRRGCPYTYYKDGRDVRSFISPPKGYELTGFKLEPFPEPDSFYDGQIVAQYEKIPFTDSVRNNFWKYVLAAVVILGGGGAGAYYFLNKNSKPTIEQPLLKPNTEINVLPVDTTVQEQSINTSLIEEDTLSVETEKEDVVTEEVVMEEIVEKEVVEVNDAKDAIIEEVSSTEKPVEQENKKDEIAPKIDPQPETTQQESQLTDALTKEQFHQEFWDLIHHKERHMRTYHDLYKKYKDLHLKTKEFFYLYLTILENTAAFEEWKAKLVRIPDDELQSINTINALKQKIEEYE